MAKVNVLLTVVRHGETNGNSNRLVHGSTDEPLNDNGRCQAGKLGDRLSQEQFDMVISSDLSRAFETASITMDRNNHRKKNKINIETDQLLRERHFGDLEGKSFDDFNEASRNEAKEHEAAGTTPADIYTMLDGEKVHAESPQAVIERAKAFLKNLFFRLCDDVNGWKKEEECNVLIASHGLLIKFMLQYLSKTSKFGDSTPTEETVQPHMKNTCVTKLRLTLDRETKTLDSGTFDLIFDASHLE